jgi:hypothetical protein
LNREISSRKSKPLWIFQHDQVDRQERSPADISQCPSETRNPTDIFIGRDFREKGIVIDIAASETNIGDDKEDRTSPIVACMHKIEEARKENSGITENHEKLFLGSRGICHGAQERSEDG